MQSAGCKVVWLVGVGLLYFSCGNLKTWFCLCFKSFLGSQVAGLTCESIQTFASCICLSSGKPLSVTAINNTPYNSFISTLKLGSGTWLWSLHSFGDLNFRINQVCCIGWEAGPGSACWAFGVLTELLCFSGLSEEDRVDFIFPKVDLSSRDQPISTICFAFSLCLRERNFLHAVCLALLETKIGQINHVLEISVFFLTQMWASTKLDEVYWGKEPAAVIFKFHWN